jgi:ribosomal protein S18 acetylase RimI-like enzyme
MTNFFIILPLSKHHRRENFDCGEESLNIFLKKFARQNSERELSKTYVAVAEETEDVLGYYTISSGSVVSDNIPENLPRYPVPVAHLGRLAVDKRAKGQKLGEILLFDALKRIAGISEQLGIYAVEVIALNESAKSFYLKYGFKELSDDELHLYLSIKVIKKLVS